ncbi:MAG: WecB/TagA/CpsF family glycosyltransferase [Syntrophales bacterium]
MDAAIRCIAGWIENRDAVYCNLCTVHTVMECRRDAVLRSIVNRSALSTTDGMPLVWLAHYHGHCEATRVYGPDLMLAVCEYSVDKGYRHFFYGGKEGVADQLATALKDRYPRLQIAGAYSPPWSSVGHIEGAPVIKRINDTAPDIVWVGLGTPKQDFWVANHRPLLTAPVIAAVGAAFDFHTGAIAQAPKWMQQHGLEWLFRLCTEPRRLAYRYIVYNPLFIMQTFLQLSGLRHYDVNSH